MTKEEIAKEYAERVGQIGHKLYRWIAPALELHEELVRLLYLNRQMASLQEQERKEAAENAKKLEMVK